ncbi:hypothetical protein DY000_02030414 [Brassica cretica]|uniref:Retrotransposon Copia-like N-terminal domain-containing protein n=1 Tax=Brassica cretica TaxID=69181 RepID=A0ABQ7DV72_BRACR|nr:hypothetical protein DY000_02030414 [Brassica cretica]
MTLRERKRRTQPQLHPFSACIPGSYSSHSPISQLATRQRSARATSTPARSSSHPFEVLLVVRFSTICKQKTNTASAPSILSLHPRQLQLTVPDQPARDPAAISSRDFNSNSFQLASVRGSLGGPVSTICKQKMPRFEPLDYAILNPSGENYLEWAMNTSVVLKSRGLGRERRP